MKLFIAMNLRYKGQVIGTLPDYEHFEARDQKEADEIAKSAGWDKAIEVTQKISGAAQAPLVVGQPASERLMKALDNRRLDEPKPSRLQVAMVLHALADHTAIMEMLKHRPDETSPWKEATSVGRWFHDVGDQLEDA